MLWTVTSRYLLHTLESKGFPLACHNIYPAKNPRGSNVASKAIPRIICYTSAYTELQYKESLAYACIGIFMHSYILICISIFARIHTNRASRFPETQKKNQRIVDYGARRIKDLSLAKEKDASRHASHMSMPCHNMIMNTIKVVIEQ